MPKKIKELFFSLALNTQGNEYKISLPFYPVDFVCMREARLCYLFSTAMQGMIAVLFSAQKEEWPGTPRRDLQPIPLLQHNRLDCECQTLPLCLPVI